MANPAADNRATSTVNEPHFTEELDRRIAQMRRLLAAMKPQSAASDLKVLREAFPDASLDQRVRALSERQRH
jgi:hypothetical protein